MPSTIQIPARTERHCCPCEHLSTKNIYHSREHGTICDYVCFHPEANSDGDDPNETDPVLLEARAHLMELARKYGRDIGKTDRQPKWCPLLQDGSNKD